MADYVSALNGSQMDQALMDMAEHNSEAFAVGERNGVPVVDGDVTYHNNSRYWAEFAAEAAEGASVITDPNKDGNLVIDQPSGSESGWAVRYDAAQTLSEVQKAQARANIAAGCSNENLLMNAWFIQASCVNQRSYTSSSSTGEVDCVDRWKVNRATASVTLTGALSSQGLSLAWDGSTSSNGVLTQRIEKSKSNAYAGKTMTVSILLADGTVHSGSFTYPANNSASVSFTSALSCTVWNNLDAYATLNIYNTSTTAVKIQAVKLELGSVSTLAQDTPPDYGTELAKCQRYFYRVSLTTQTDPFAVGIAYSGDLRFLLPIGKMRATPTVATTSVSAIAIRGEGLSGATVTGLTFITQNELGVYLKAATSASLTSYQLYAMTMTSNSAIIDLSADL